MQSTKVHECRKKDFLYDSIQIINIKIDVDKFNQTYYEKIRNRIKKNIKPSDLLLINFIPNKPISDKWVLFCLLDLQRDFTDVLTIPQNVFSESDLDDWLYSFNPYRLVKIL